jgi:hypothetical protein
MTFSSHTLLFEPHSHRFFGKRFGRFLPMDGVRSRIVLPNLSGGHAGKSASRSIRNRNVTTDKFPSSSTTPIHRISIFPGLIFQSFFSCSLRILSGTWKTKSNTACRKLSNSFRVGEAEGDEAAGVHLSRPRNPESITFGAPTVPNQ